MKKVSNNGEKKLVSVVIAAYNTEHYISDMLTCLENQTYKNIQIIIVDDGSTDKTAQIIKKYAKKDERIEYYYQNNQGVSAARNYGMEKVRGEKLFFLDSDDTFEFDLIQECMNYALENNVDSVLYGHADKVNGEITKEHKFHIHGNFVGGDTIVKKILPHFLGHSYMDINDWLEGKCGLRDGKEHTALWRVMLDYSVIKNANIRFDTNLSLGEDTKFINTYFLYANSIGVLEKTLYYLTIRDGSANVSSNANPILMTRNKLKLIEARKDIDASAMKKGYKTEYYWLGTMVLSGVQLALRLSHNRMLSKLENKRVYITYIENENVKKAIKNFEPVHKIKAIPFFLLKFNKGMLLFDLCSFLPMKLIEKLGG